LVVGRDARGDGVGGCLIERAAGRASVVVWRLRRRDGGRQESGEDKSVVRIR